jgi:RimJ/RimL family protein N-acetyltransferase
VSDLNVRCLEPHDADALMALRREALSSEPLAFGASLDDDRTLSPDLLRASLAAADNSAIIGAFDGHALVGMAGVFRMDKLKARHRAMIWGMFVAPAARGRGVGAAILQAAIDRARSWPGIVQVHLSVTETSEDAGRLYRSMGFRPWGVEPRALHWEGRFVAEHHMVLDLASAATRATLGADSG